MSYNYVIGVDVGNLFERIFSPVSWISTTEDTTTLFRYLQYGKTPAKNLPKPSPAKNLHLSAPMISALSKTMMTSIELLYEGPITVRGERYRSVECGGEGDCFFRSISRGLGDFNINRTHSELRLMLAEWLEDTENSRNFGVLLSASPSDIIPYLGHMASHCPINEGLEKGDFFFFFVLYLACR